MTTKYTVLLLRPDSDWYGHQSDWVLREHIEADSIEAAPEIAIKQVLASEYGKKYAEAGDTLEDFATMAIYEGHIFDLFTP